MIFLPLLLALRLMRGSKFTSTTAPCIRKGPPRMAIPNASSFNKRSQESAEFRWAVCGLAFGVKITVAFLSKFMMAAPRANSHASESHNKDQSLSSSPNVRRRPSCIQGRIILNHNKRPPTCFLSAWPSAFRAEPTNLPKLRKEGCQEPSRRTRQSSQSVILLHIRCLSQLPRNCFEFRFDADGNMRLDNCNCRRNKHIIHRKGMLLCRTCRNS